MQIKKKKIKEPLFHCRDISLVKRKKIISTFKIYFETWKFFHKTLVKSRLKAGKIKKSQFQKLYVRRPGNRKHSFFIT